jgi:hypothetical protein
MSKHTTSEGTLMPNSEKSEPLRVVPYDKGFHFYTSTGNYTGETATSLVNFAAKLQVIEVESVNFHFKRSDFQKWIRDVVGDAKLAERINQIKSELTGEDLRKELLKMVQTRISELQTAHLHHSQHHHK